MARRTLIVNEGADFSLTHVVRDSSGDPVDLTGYSARLGIRENDINGARCARLTNDSDTIGGTLELGGVEGTVAIALTAQQTLALRADILVYDYARSVAPRKRKVRFVYDLELVDPAGGVTRELEGEITLYREVTV